MYKATFSIGVSPALVILLAFGCDGQGSARQVAKSAVADAPAETVEVTVAQRRTLTRQIPIVGTLFAAEEAVISTRTSGILRRTFVDVGSIVKPDAPLAQVDVLDYEVAVRQAQSALAEVLARLGVREVPDASFDPKSVSSVIRAEAQLENARFSHERLLRMIDEGMANVADQELNDAATRLHVAEADVRLANDETAALVASAGERQSTLQMAQQRLANTLTRTPPIPTTLGREGADEWVVAARYVTEGQYLNVADQLYRLMVNNPLKLRSKVPERYAGDVRLGQRIELEDYSGALVWRGEITRISPFVDPISRTFEIEALLDNESNTLKPGTFEKGVIIADGVAPVVCVPVESILTSGGTTRVFAVEDGKARQRKVRTGWTSEGWIEIASGIRDGEQIVTRGAAVLIDGAAVQVRTGS